jgi:hypothetical protein
MSLLDFNFLFGKWRIHNRVLSQRLCGAHEWCEFPATFECRSLGVLGNVGHYRSVCNGEPMEGVSLRLYNPHTGEWTMRWADTPRPGCIQPPVVGRFEGFRAFFYGNAFYDAKPVRVRVIWTRGPRPRFEQAFSLDRGRTWETNWIMRLTPAAAREMDRDTIGECARYPEKTALAVGSVSRSQPPAHSPSGPRPEMPESW